MAIAIRDQKGRFLPQAKVAAVPVKSSIPTGEVGAAQVMGAIGGFFYLDYNPNLRGRLGFETIERMMKSNGEVHAVKLAIALPIRAVKWHVKAGGTGAADLEAAALVEANLFGGTMNTFDNLLRQALCGLWYGYFLSEMVVQQQEGYYRWQKFAPRHPKTADFGRGINMDGWELDANGVVIGWWQLQYATAKLISVDRLLRWCWNDEEGNANGVSHFRAAYTHWYILDSLMRIANIGHEKNYVGTPIGKLPPGKGDEDARKMMAILQNLMAHENAAVTLPDGYLIELLEGKRGLSDIQPYIDYQTRMIARSVLAQFIDLGSSSTGSFALSDSHMGLFLLELDAVAAWIAEIINRQAIAPLCQYNEFNLQKFPELCKDEIRMMFSTDKTAQALNFLASAKLITPGPEIEHRLREIYGISDELPADANEETEPAAGLEIAPADVKAGGTAINITSGRQAAAPVAPENKSAALQTIADRRAMTAAAQDAFQTKMAGIAKKMQDSLKGSLSTLVDQYRAAPDIAKGKVIAKMTKVSLPYEAEYASAIESWERDFVAAYRSVLEKEMSLDLSKTPISNAFRQYMVAKSKLLARNHGETLRTTIILNSLRGLVRDIDAKTLINNAPRQTASRLSAQLYHDLNQIGQEFVAMMNEEMAAALQPIESTQSA